MPAQLTPLSKSHLIRSSPHTAIPSYFCPISYNPLIYVTARKGTRHFCNTHRLQGPKNHTGPLGRLLPRALAAHLAARLFLRWLFSSSTESFLGTKQPMKPVTEAEATWPRAAPNVTKGILPRPPLRGLGSHLLVENNSHICHSGASRSYLLWQSSFLLRPDFFSS